MINYKLVLTLGISNRFKAFLQNQVGGVLAHRCACTMVMVCYVEQTMDKECRSHAFLTDSHGGEKRSHGQNEFSR